MDQPFTKLSKPVLDAVLAGQDLILRTVIPSRIVKKFPKEVAILQHAYDTAYYKFRKRIKKLEESESDKISLTDEEKAVITEIERRKKEGRR